MLMCKPTGIYISMPIRQHVCMGGACQWTGRDVSKSHAMIHATPLGCQQVCEWVSMVILSQMSV